MLSSTFLPAPLIAAVIRSLIHVVHVREEPTIARDEDVIRGRVRRAVHAPELVLSGDGPGSGDAVPDVGHPEPLDCPEGQTRKSLALYYYSLAPEALNGKRRSSHNTLFMPRQADTGGRLKAAVRGVAPPVLVSLARAARRRSRART